MLRPAGAAGAGAAAAASDSPPSPSASGAASAPSSAAAAPAAAARAARRRRFAARRSARSSSAPASSPPPPPPPPSAGATAAAAGATPTGASEARMALKSATAEESTALPAPASSRAAPSASPGRRRTARTAAEGPSSLRPSPPPSFQPRPFRMRAPKRLPSRAHAAFSTSGRSDIFCAFVSAARRTFFGRGRRVSVQFMSLSYECHRYMGGVRMAALLRRPQLAALLLLSLLCGAAQARDASVPWSIVTAARDGGVRQPSALAVAAAAAARRRALQSSTAAHPGNLMCENYDLACNSVLTLAGCDANPLNRVVLGCAGAGNGTLDQFIGRCNCTSPFPLGTPSDRVRDRLFSAAVAGLNAAALVNYAAGGEAPPPLLVPTAGYSGPNATFDVGASFGALCARALIALGCPVGREVIVPISPNTTVGGASFRCGCGPTLDVTAAALTMVIDGIVANNTARVATVFVKTEDDDSAPSTELMCQKRSGWFGPTCGLLLTGANCSAGLNNGCLNSNLANFPAQCICYAPYYFDAGARIAEIVYDSHVVNNLTALLVNASAPVQDNGRSSIDFTRSFSSVCKRALPLSGCKDDVITPTAPTTPTDTTAYFCGCSGNFVGIPTLRTQTQLIDYLAEPTMLIAATAAAAAAIVPQPPPPSIATTASLGAAVAFLVLILIGLSVYIASLKGLVKLPAAPACCGACAAGIKARTGVSLPSGLGSGTKMMAPGSDWAPNSPQRVARANQLLPLPAGAGGAQAVQPPAVLNPVPAAAAAAAATLAPPPPPGEAPAEPPGIATD